MKYALAATAAILAAPANAESVGPYSDLIVFGDSLSDPGNVNFLTEGAIPPEPFYTDGQYTNGEAWASQLGADFESGTNFAYGDAKAVGGEDDIVPDFEEQRDLFLNSYADDAYADDLGDNPLTAVWLGGNDLRVLLDPEAPLLDPFVLIDSVTTEIVTGIMELADTRLDDFLVFGLPDLGLIPAVVNDPEDSAAGTFLTDSFNAMLYGKIDAFFTDNPLINVSFFDTKSFFADLLEDADELGLKNLTEACLVFDDDKTDENEFSYCGFNGEDPNTYVFFDGLHPTQPIHSALAAGVRDFVTPVPLPGGMGLALGGFALLGFAARRRKVASRKH